jgi:hypothetical protein
VFEDVIWAMWGFVFGHLFWVAVFVLVIPDKMLAQLEENGVILKPQKIESAEIIKPQKDLGIEKVQQIQKKILVGDTLTEVEKAKYKSHLKISESVEF